ncbi:hypothetical protein BMS92_04230, partial [Leuconostoc mesenteroides subsp. mesenteroides]
PGVIYWLASAHESLVRDRWRGWLIPLEWWPYKCYGSYYNASVACLALELRAGPWVLQCGHE